MENNKESNSIELDDFIYKGLIDYPDKRNYPSDDYPYICDCARFERENKYVDEKMIYRDDIILSDYNKKPSDAILINKDTMAILINKVVELDKTNKELQGKITKLGDDKTKIHIMVAEIAKGNKNLLEKVVELQNYIDKLQDKVDDTEKIAKSIMDKLHI